jgi:hypothetical protein
MKTESEDMKADQARADALERSALIKVLGRRQGIKAIKSLRFVRDINARSAK